MDFKDPQRIETDVLVIGGGSAGMRAAIEAKRHGLEVVLVSESKVGFKNNSAISKAIFAATGIWIWSPALRDLVKMVLLKPRGRMTPSFTSHEMLRSLRSESPIFDMLNISSTFSPGLNELGVSPILISVSGSRSTIIPIVEFVVFLLPS